MLGEANPERAALLNAVYALSDTVHALLLLDDLGGGPQPGRELETVEVLLDKYKRLINGLEQV